MSQELSWKGVTWKSINTADATNQKLTWTCSNTSMVEVFNTSENPLQATVRAKVGLVSYGTVTITARATDGSGVYATLIFSVTPKVDAARPQEEDGFAPMVDAELPLIEEIEESETIPEWPSQEPQEADPQPAEVPEVNDYSPITEPEVPYTEPVTEPVYEEVYSPEVPEVSYEQLESIEEVPTETYEEIPQAAPEEEIIENTTE